MTVDARKPFCLTLGARMDTLNATLLRTQRGDESALTELREQCRSLAGEAEALKLESIANMARMVANVPPPLVAASVPHLVKAMRDEASRIHQTGVVAAPVVDEQGFRAACEAFLAACTGSLEPAGVALLRTVPPSRAPVDIEHQRTLLEKLAEKISHLVRTTDIVAHTSSREILLLFPGSDEVSGQRALEKLVPMLKEAQSDEERRTGRRPGIIIGITLLDGRLSVQEVISQAYTCTADAPVEYDPVIVRSGMAAHEKRCDIMFAPSDSATAKVVNALLAQHGGKLNSCRDLDGLADGLSKRRYHVVLIDMEFNGDQGIEALALVRTIQAYDRVPIVMLIANDAAAHTHLVQAYTAGASDCVFRPIDPTSFLNRLSALASHCGQAGKANSEGATLLMVDESVPDLFLAGTVLVNRGGYRILLAHDKEDALARISSDRPDHLLLSGTLQDAEIAEICGALRKSGAGGRSEALVALWDREADRREELREAGATGFLRRPYDIKNLPDQVARVVGPGPGVPQPSFALEINRIARAVASEADKPGDDAVTTPAPRHRRSSKTGDGATRIIAGTLVSWSKKQT